MSVRLRFAPLHARLASACARIRDRLPVAGIWSLRALVAAAALAALGTYATLAVLHLRFPFELEWMEGGLVDAARRAIAGQKLYVRPSLDYVPYIYPPLWFYVAAAFGKVFGPGFFSARLCSITASVGAIGLIYRIVQREGRSHPAALLAAAFYAATYRLASCFFDIARVDSLFVVLLLAGLYTLRARTSVLSRLGAAALFTLAFLTKQSAPLAFAPVALHVLLTERGRSGLAFAAGGAAMMLGAALLLNRIYDGWFGYFVFFIPRLHPLVPEMWTSFWLDDLLAPVGVCVVLALFSVTVDRGIEGRRFWAAALAGMLGVSWLGRLHVGGWSNVIMPAYAILAVLAGFAIASGLALAKDQPEARRRTVEAFLLTLAAIQFAALVYDPRRFIPTAADVAAGNELVDRIRKVNGDVYVLARPHLALMAGKRLFAQQTAVEDVVFVDGGPPAAALRAEILDAIDRKRFGAIVVDTDFFREEIEARYRPTAEPFKDADTFWPVMGLRVRPKALYVPY